MTEDEINKQVSKETSSMSSVSVGIDLDNQALRGLQDTVQAINKEAKEMATNFKEALEALKEMGKDYGLTQVISYTENSPGGTGGGGGGAQRGAAGTTIVGGRAHETKPVTPAVDSVAAALGGFKAFQTGAGFAPQFAPGGSIDGRKLTTGGTGAIGLAEKFQAGGGFTGAGNFANMAGTLAKVGVQAIDKRVEDARPYALAADKSTLQMQQITGMSQRGVMDNLRMPLTDYKLGTNGINQLMSLQARTGINASQQASSVEFMRTLSGFSMGAEGASSIIESLAAPETVNKMFMMTGMSLIGPGGKQKSTQSLIQGLAKRAGLDNKNIAESAIAPGSVTRATLSAMGVSGDLQDQVIQYGQANVNFREKGGKGSYDPTKEADRKRMGIDDTFAMEAEETERKRGKRDEKFYQDQAGSYAKLERQTQRLTDAMAKLEQVMAPIISARTGSRIAQKVLGGIGSMLSNIPIVGGLLGSIGGILGDPRPSNSRYIGDDNAPWNTVPPSMTVPPSGGGGGGGGGGTTTTTIPNSPPVTGLSWPNTIGAFSGPTARQEFLASLGISNSDDRKETLTAFSGIGGTPQNGGPQHNNIPGFDTPENFAIMGNSTTAPGTGLNGSLNAAIRRLANRAYAETNGKVQLKLASGRRSAEEQEAWWNQRMQVVPNGYKLPYYKDDFDGKNYNLVRYKGKLWMKKPGNSEPPIAAPGTSLHELGLAADLDLSDPAARAYVNQNLWRFGLSSGKADGEPGHIQLAWTKDMSVSQFLGSTAMSYEEAFLKGSGTDEDGGFRNSSPNMFNASTLAEFGGVNLNQFNRSFLTRLGTTITLNKLKALTAISGKEGSGGNYNPWNVVSNNNRFTPDGVKRVETHFNINGKEEGSLVKTNNYPVQNFDSFKEGVDSTLYHYLANNEAFMKVLMEDDPSMERIQAVLSSLKGVGSVLTLRNLRGAVTKNWNDAVGAKNVQGIANSYGAEGLNEVIPITDWSKKMGAWGGSVGDPVSGSSMQPMSIPSSPMLSSSGSSGGGGTYHEGSTVTISPIINMTSTGNSGTVSEYDLRSMAKKIAKLIEQEANITKFRSM